MKNILFDLYQKKQLPHALLIESDKLSVSQLVEKFASELSLDRADYLLLTEEPIKIIQIRELIHVASLSRSTGSIKLIAIPDATSLTPESANALLKTLEEPPRDTHLILGARSIDAVLPTIRSRCQVIHHKSTEASTDESSSAAEKSSLAEYFQLSKVLASGDKPLGVIINEYIVYFSNKPLTSQIAARQSISLKYLALAQHNPNRRLFLDNFFLEIYNRG